MANHCETIYASLSSMGGSVNDISNAANGIFATLGNIQSVI